MIKIKEPISISVQHVSIREYMINGLELTEKGGESLLFKSYAKMAYHLGLTRQGLYNKIKKKQFNQNEYQ